MRAVHVQMFACEGCLCSLAFVILGLETWRCFRFEEITSDLAAPLLVSALVAPRGEAIGVTGRRRKVRALGPKELETLSCERPCNFSGLTQLLDFATLLELARGLSTDLTTGLKAWSSRREAGYRVGVELQGMPEIRALTRRRRSYSELL